MGANASKNFANFGQGFMKGLNGAMDVAKNVSQIISPIGGLLGGGSKIGGMLGDFGKIGG